MKITPLEIRQKEFEKTFRGYDKEEVSAFLLSLSHEWEKLLEETRTLKLKLEASEREVQKLRDVETSLYKTLKTAEDTGANMIDQANKTAELHLKEAEMNAEALISEAKSKAKASMEKAEVESRGVIEDMRQEIQKLEEVYSSLQNRKQNLILELKNISSDLLEKVDRIKESDAKQPVEIIQKRVKTITRASETVSQEETPSKKNKAKVIKMESEEQPAEVEAPAEIPITKSENLRPPKRESANKEATLKKANSDWSKKSQPQELEEDEDKSFFDQLQ